MSEKGNLSVKRDRDRGIDLNLDVHEDRCMEGSKRVKVEVTQPDTVQIGYKVKQNSSSLIY